VKLSRGNPPSETGCFHATIAVVSLEDTADTSVGGEGAAMGSGEGDGDCCGVAVIGLGDGEGDSCGVGAVIGLGDEADDSWEVGESDAWGEGEGKGDASGVGDRPGEGSGAKGSGFIPLSTASGDTLESGKYVSKTALQLAESDKAP